MCKKTESGWMCLCCWYRNYSDEMPLQIAAGSPLDGSSSIQGKITSWFGSEKRPYYNTFQVVRFYILSIIFGLLFLFLSYYFLTFLTPWNWKGTNKQLWAVTGYIYLFPIGFMLTINGISGIVIIKEITPRLRAIIMAIFAISSLFGLVLINIFLCF